MASPNGDKFFIRANDTGLDAITGTFSGLPEGAMFPVPETSDPIDYWQISYVENGMAGSDGNDVRLLYIPEPGSSALSVGAAALLLMRRRRSRTESC